MKPFTYAIPCLFGLEGLVGDPQRPCEPCYNLHMSSRWVACTALYCFQLPTGVLRKKDRAERGPQSDFPRRMSLGNRFHFIAHE